MSAPSALVRLAFLMAAVAAPLCAAAEDIDATDKFLMACPRGRETITFIPDKEGNINEVRIATFDVYTLRFIRAGSN